jgi:hypothetical protein
MYHANNSLSVHINVLAILSDINWNDPMLGKYLCLLLGHQNQCKKLERESRATPYLSLLINICKGIK